MGREIICGIYSITNLQNNKIYIGSSIDIYRRWTDHRSKLKSGTHRNERLSLDWNTYGEDAFNFAIICKCNKEDLIKQEQKFINKFNSANEEYGYNIQPLAGRVLYKGITFEDVKNGKLNLSLEDCVQLEYFLTSTDIPLLELSKILDINYATIDKIYRGKQYKNIFDSSKFIKRSIISGEKHYKSFLTTEEVEDIIEMLKDGMTNLEIANLYGVDHHFIKDIRTHRSWIHLTKDIEFPKPKRKNLSRRKPVSAYDKEMNFIKTYDSLEEAAIAVGAPSAQNIGSCAQGKKKTAYGYIWRYVS